MQINSEIRRYYWLDFSLQRIIAMPGVLLAILCVMVLSDSHVSSIMSFYSTLFVIIAIVWGGHQAAKSITDDVQSNCWDNQRLSSVSPWELCLGKLVGSTLYSWYGGIIALMIYVYYSLQNGTEAVAVFYDALLYVLSALLCHIIALLCSLQSLRSDSRYSRFHSLAYLICGLVVAQFFYRFTNDHIIHSLHGDNESTLSFFSMEIDSAFFAILSLLLAIGWGIIGLVRLMREELQFKNIPWIWALFVLFMMIYVAGIYKAPAGDVTNSPYWMHRHAYAYGHHSTIFENMPDNYLFERNRLGIAALWASVSVYLMFFADNLTITRYRMLIDQWRRRNWRKVAETIPRWAVSFAMTFVTMLVLVLTADMDRMGGATLFTISYVLFVLRDAAIIHYCRLSANSRRAAMAAAFYLAILYGLLPSLAVAFHMKYALFIFYPAFNEHNNILMLFPVIIELLAAGWLLYQRFITMNKEIASHDL